MREPLHSLAIVESFSHFQPQDEHKRFVNQYIWSGASTKPTAKIRIGNDFAKFIFRIAFRYASSKIPLS